MDLSDQHEGQCELLTNMNLLREVQFFKGLAPEFLRVMAYLCERQLFAPDQIILPAGEPAEVAVVLIRGSALIERGERCVATVGAGQCLGGMALLGRFRLLYSLRAETETECLVLPRRKFMPQFMAHPEALALVTQELISTVVAWDRQQLDRPDTVRTEGLGML